MSCTEYILKWLNKNKFEKSDFTYDKKNVLIPLDLLIPEWPEFLKTKRQFKSYGHKRNKGISANVQFLDSYI